MQIEIMQSKIHRATVTDANLNYTGSITIARELATAASLVEFQKVDIVNINNGERFSTYVIVGDKKGEICLNGAAARKVAVGDLVIIIAYATIDYKDAKGWQPTIVHVNGENNEILK